MSRSNCMFSSLALALATLVQPAISATLEVEVGGIEAQQGELRIALYDSKEAWEGKAARRAGQVGKPDGSPALRFTFADLPPGEYAVRVMHDENGNGRMDSNLFGIPKEGHGASNNPRVMRAPHFEEAAFMLGEADLSIRITLN